MAEAFYPPRPATDGTLAPVPGAVFQVFELADTTYSTPLSLRVGDGNPQTSLTATESLATLPGVYVTSPNFSHNFVSGDFVWRRDSFDQAQKATEEARAAAESVANRAANGEFKGATGPQGVPGRDGSNVLPTDAAITEALTTPGAGPYEALGDSTAQIVSITAHGVSSSNTAAQNTPLFQAAIDAAAAQRKPLFIPPLPGNEYYNVDNTLIVPGNMEIYGAGRASRVRQWTRPHSIFRVTGPATRLHDFAVFSTSRDGSNFTAWVRDTREVHLNSGIMFQAGSDGGQAWNIYGETIHIVVNANAYSDQVGDYAGTNINGLTIRGIRANNVWSAVHIREVDNLVIEDVQGNYSKTVGYGGLPHLVYVAYVGTVEGVPVRHMRGVSVSNCRAYDGADGVAFAIKAVRGGTVSDMMARNCAGIIDYDEDEDVQVIAPVSMDDRTPLGSASHYMLSCKRVTIEGGTTRFQNMDHGIAVSVHSTNSDCVIRDHSVVSNHSVASTSASNADVYLQGTNNTLDGVRVDNIGQSSGVGILAINTTGVTIRNPYSRGNRRAVMLQNTALGVKLEYRPEDLIPSAVAGAQKVEVVAGATFTVPPIPALEPGLLAWDSGHFASGSGNTWNVLSSGQAISPLKGTWTVDTDRRIKVVNNADALATWDLATPNVTLEAEIEWGGGNGAGFALRAVDLNNHLLVDIYAGRLFLGYRQAGAGRALIAEDATFVPVAGRRYRVKATVFGDQITAWVDGQQRSTGTIPAGVHTALGAATSHGLRGNGEPNSRWADIRARRS